MKKTNSFIFLLLILFVNLTLFALEKSTFITQDNKELGAEFLHMKNDTIYVKVIKKDSSIIKKAIYKSAFKEVILSPNDTLDLNLSNYPEVILDSIIDYDPWENIGIEVEVSETIDTIRKASIQVKVTDTELDTNKNLNNIDTPFVAKKEVKSQRDIDTIDISPNAISPNTDTLPFKQDNIQKLVTNLQILSKPSEAEIYFNTKQTIKRKPKFFSPMTIDSASPSSIEIHFFKVGYKDTTVKYQIMLNSSNRLTVKLSKLDNPKLLEEQNLFIKRRKQRRISRPLLFTSIITAGISAAMSYKANNYYERAIAYKRKLEAPDAILDMGTFESNKGKNERRTERWKLYRTGAWGFLGLTAVCAGVGFTLYF